MEININYRRSKRFYPKQLQILNFPTRFTIIEALPQCGKTETCLTWLFEKFLTYKMGDIGWWIEPTYEMSKSLGFNRLKMFIDECRDLFEFNETALSIKNKKTGGLIKFKSGDHPDNLYGDTIKDVVLDEASRMKEDVYFACYSRIIQTKGNMKLIGNVTGSNNWSYKLARRVEAGELHDWSYLKISPKDAIDANVLSQEMINDAEATLPKGVFLELYYGIPFENASNKFFYSFDERKHVGSCKVNTEYPVYLSFDFNYNPICCGIFQFINGVIYCPDIIKLANSNIYNICNAINAKYPYAVFIVTGDASGSSNSAMVKDNLNYYRIIKAELNLSSNQIQVSSANPRFEENQVLCNAVLEHMPVQIDPEKASGLIFDLKFAQIDNNKKLIKTDRNDPTQQLDCGDLWRYYISQFHKNILKTAKNSLSLQKCLI